MSPTSITISLDSDLLLAVRAYCEEKGFRVGPYLRAHTEACVLADEEFSAFLAEYERKKAGI